MVSHRIKDNLLTRGSGSLRITSLRYRYGISDKEGDSMCKIHCEIGEGLIPSEKTVLIKGADGRTEEVAVSQDQIKGNLLLASEIGRSGDQVLIELPRESAAGRWRIWVSLDQLER
jgi:hypothetical protein